jgi:NADH dehydrogenase FAD-containing subunit
MNTAKTIVILGGGVGVVIADSTLRKQLEDQHRLCHSRMAPQSDRQTFHVTLSMSSSRARTGSAKRVTR